jgi:hypothetical protein
LTTNVEVGATFRFARMTPTLPSSFSGEQHRLQTPSRRARLYLWPAMVALAGPLILVAGTVCCGLNFFWRVYGISSVLVLWVLAALCAAWFAVRNFNRSKWRSALPALVLPIVLFCAIPGRFRLVQSCGELGHFLLFRARRSDYVARVAAMPDDGRPKLAIFSLGGMVWYSEAIVYDESDELVLPPEQRSASWTERARHLEFVCGFWARPLGDHFYLVGFSC